jgi:hypothetical protein
MRRDFLQRNGVILADSAPTDDLAVAVGEGDRVLASRFQMSPVPLNGGKAKTSRMIAKMRPKVAASSAASTARRFRPRTRKFSSHVL